MIQDGEAKLVNVKNQDGLTKVLDMVPDLINRFSGDKKEKKSQSEIGDEKA